MPTGDGARRGLYWFIARHYLGATRGRGLLSLITWIALGGVTVGVMALVVVIAVMTGMQNDLRNKILDSTPHLIVQEQSVGSLRVHDWPRVVDSVLAVGAVTAASPVVLTQVAVIKTGLDGRYSQSANLYGIDLDPERVPPTEMERQIVEGVLSLNSFGTDLPPLLLGSILADRLGAFTGDTLLVMAMENMRDDPLTGGLRPKMRPFVVTGTFSTGMYDYDLQNAYTSLAVGQDLLDLPQGTASLLGARVQDPDRAEEVAAVLRERLGFPYFVSSWGQINDSLFGALKLEKIAMGVILFLIVLVAALNIVSTLVMVVTDRTREIGILKAMGMTRRGILNVFVLQGAWIGITGTAIGAVLGVVVSVVQDRFEVVKIPPDVYFVDHLPVSLEPLDVVMIIGGSIAISFIATIYPALQASRLEPVDAIRHE